jgi:hypothetical protein
LKLIRIAVDEKGCSYFDKSDVTMELKDFAPPAAPLQASAFQPASQWGLLRLPVGWDGSWHPTPVQQLIICLAGQFEITVGDGRSRCFGPGEMVLLEDTEGRGHVTKVVGSEEVECLSVQL